MDQIKSIIIIGLKWFDKFNGNTYHAAITYVDGIAYYTGYQYGYGDQYQWSAAETLEAAGVITRLRYPYNGNPEALWTYCERNKIKLHAHEFHTNKAYLRRIDEIIDSAKKDQKARERAIRKVERTSQL